MAIKVMEETQKKTLIIVPKIDLLDQFIDEIRKFSNHRDIGVMQGSSSSIRDITVATIQTLIKHAEIIDFRQFGLLIVDECDSFTSKKRRALIAKIPAYYRYGFTGTNRRSDGQGEAIQFVFGPTLVKRIPTTRKPSVFVVESTAPILSQEYADMIEDQVNNVKRNILVEDVIRQEIGSGRKVLVLTKRIAHFENLYARFKGPGVIAFRSKDKRGDRANRLAKLRSGEQDFTCLFGTMPLLSRGIDIPSLDTLIIAGDLKSDVLTEQAAGRILRLFKGKNECRIIDVVDTKNRILARQGRLREVFYKENGWDVQPYIFNDTKG